MKTLPSLLLAALALLCGSPRVTAQSYRVDFGANTLFPAPPPSYYFDCGLCPTGQWNAVDGNAQGLTPIFDVSGAQTGVTLERSGGLGNFQFNSALTVPGSGDEDLLDDLQNVGPVGFSTTWTLRGLPNGVYKIKVCAFGADDPTQLTAITVLGGARGKRVIGGFITAPLHYGAVYSYDYVGVLNGELSFTAQTEQGFGSLNGFLLDPDFCSSLYYFCPPKVNSLGCTPIWWNAGNASASATSGFFVRVRNVLNHKSGLLMYGFNGRAAIPFQGGQLCVQPPLHRSIIVQSNGAPLPANDCSGNFILDMNAFAAGLAGGNPHPSLRIPGTLVTCQWWGRDPGFPAPDNSTLSPGLQYFVCP